MESETKGYLFIVLGIFIFIISLITFFSMNKITKTNLSSTQDILEQCNILQYNGPAKINMLFFANKEAAQRYTDFFLKSNPFNKNKEAFNFYYLDSYEPNCQFYKGIAILCQSDELIRKAASCPHDFIIVLKDEDDRIRSSSYLNVLSINSRHLLTVLIHEFGHSFANLAEEYTPAKLPRGQPNCKIKCSDFKEEIDGCFQECSETTYYRSVDKGIMRTLTPEDMDKPYGTFNTGVIQELILERLAVNFNEPITGKVTNELRICSEEQYILSDIEIKEGISKVNNIVLPGCLSGTTGKGDYTYKILDKEEDIIRTDDFNANLYSDVQNEELNQLEGETFSHDEVGRIILTLPVEGDKLIVTDSNNKEIIQTTLYDAGARPCPA